MSTLANHEIETIVRMVIDRLRDSAVASSTDSLTTRALLYPESNGLHSSSVVANASTTELTEPGILVIPTSPITLDDIAGKLGGIHTLRISARSLLTPAVKDELRRAKIVVARGTAQVHPSQTKTGAMVAGSFYLIASEEKSSVIKSVAKLITINALSTGLTLLDTISQLAKLDASGRSIWCSPRPYAAQMACSQVSASIRAAFIHQAVDLSQAVAEINPNLLVLDDARWSGYQVGRLIQNWSRIEKQGGPR